MQRTVGNICSFPELPGRARDVDYAFYAARNDGLEEVVRGVGHCGSVDDNGVRVEVGIEWTGRNGPNAALIFRHRNLVQAIENHRDRFRIRRLETEDYVAVWEDLRRANGLAESWRLARLTECGHPWRQ